MFCVSVQWHATDTHRQFVITSKRCWEIATAAAPPPPQPRTLLCVCGPLLCLCGHYLSVCAVVLRVCAALCTKTFLSHGFCVLGLTRDFFIVIPQRCLHFRLLVCHRHPSPFVANSKRCWDTAAATAPPQPRTILCVCVDYYSACVDNAYACVVCVLRMCARVQVCARRRSFRTVFVCWG